MRVFVLLFGFFGFSSQSMAGNDDSWLDSGKQWVKQLWQDDAEKWLERINPAVVNHNYKGVLVLVQGNAIETLSVDHRMSNGEENLVLRTLSGAPRELIKRGSSVRTDALPNSPATATRLAASQTSFSQFANAGNNKWYNVKLADKARIAGRPTQRIDIIPEDKWRYGYRLWLDEETGLPLKILTLDERGQSVEQMMFTQIQISAVSKIMAANKPKAVDLPKSPFKEVKGFQLIAKSTKANSSHYLFSDGIASLSLYVEASPLKERAQMRKDAVSGLIFGNGKTRYVVVGKAPLETLERLLNAASKE